MRNSKTTLLGILIRGAVFLFVFILLEHIAAILLSPYNNYTRLMMYEMYYQEEPVDYIFIGGSTTYRYFNPEVFDTELSINSINLGSSNQTPKDSYYLLKEAFNHYSPQKVFIGFVPEWFYATEIDRSFASLLIYDYMIPSRNKLDYFLNAFQIDNYPDVFLRSYRYRNNLRLEKILDTLAVKGSKEYRTYQYDFAQSNMEYYQGKGFVFSTKAFPENGLGKPSNIESISWHSNKLDEEMLWYMRKISDLCDQHEVELVLISVPRPWPYYVLMDDYGAASEYINTFCLENGIEYYDFGLIRKEVLSRENHYYYDLSHMNGEGATAFSSTVIQLMNELEAGDYNPKDFFYPSLEQMMLTLDEIQTVWVDINTMSGMTEIAAQSIQANHINVEYRFYYLEEKDGVPILLRDYSEDNIVSIASDVELPYAIRVEARLVGSQDEYQKRYDQML